MIVSFSGIDGSGKTHVATRAAEELRRRGIEAKYTAPAYRSFSEFKRRTAEDTGDCYGFYGLPTAADAISCLVTDWWTWWSDNRAVATGRTVLCCDRYVPDVHAQAGQLGVPIDRFAHRLGRLPRADMSFVLTVDAVTARRRIEARAAVKPNRSETIPWLDRLAGIFDQMADDATWGFIRLDASRSPQLTVSESVNMIADQIRP